MAFASKSSDTYLVYPISPDLKDKCIYCSVEFGYLNFLTWRRHHCRSCGASTCSIHSHLKYEDNRESRICSNIYRYECDKKRANEMSKKVPWINYTN